MDREQLLDERCARFRDLIQFLTFYIDPKTPLTHRFDDMVAGGRITINDARYLSGYPESAPEKKPEVLVIPKAEWNKKRLKNLVDAMEKYMRTGKSIPKEWIEEYNDLIKEGI